MTGILSHLTIGNDGVQFTTMVITKPELRTSQKNSQHNNKNPIPDTQESHNETKESEWMTLTTITSRTPTEHTGGRGWRPGSRRGGGRSHGHNRSMITCF